MNKIRITDKIMKNFDYHTPTRLVFGRGVVEKLPEVMKPLGKRVLLTYGGGSIRRIGLYSRVKELMRDFELFELGGIEPNPKYAGSVLDGVRLCKKERIDSILAVGGGSVLDCSKAIAAGAKYDGETWDLIVGRAPTKAALPIVDIMTLAATGSEYDCGGVISRTETNDKVAYVSPFLFPVCSFLDPTYTFSVNSRHTAAGVADAVNHVMEQFFTEPSNSVSDGFCAALVKTLMKYAPVAIAQPENYEARAEIMYACTFGCNGILGLGTGGSVWPMHAIEHALSAYYDISHGEGLAIITPHWMRHVLCERTLPRFVSFGINALGISPDFPAREIADQAIAEMAAFFKKIGAPMSLREVGIDGSRLGEMARRIAAGGCLDAPGLFAPLGERDILAILRAAL